MIIYSLSGGKNMKKDYNLLLDLDIQLFADGNLEAGGQPGDVGQLSFEPKFGMSEFNEFLSNNKDAQTLFNAKIENATMQKIEGMRSALLEEAKSELAKQQSKQPWEIEIDNLRIENEKIRQQSVVNGIKTELSNRLIAASITGLDAETVNAICLKETAEESYATFDKLVASIRNAAETMKNNEIEKRMNGYAFNPAASTGGTATNESIGLSVARQVVAQRKESHDRSSRAAKHYNL